MGIVLNDPEGVLSDYESSHIGSIPAQTTSQLLASVLAERNGYGRIRLAANRIGLEHQGVIDDFSNHFSSRGYLSEDSTSIANEGVDNSVYFIGAPISVLKHYIVDGNIPIQGVYLHQDCIRTKNTKILLDDSIVPTWGSCFSGLATLVTFEDRKKLLQDSIDYLLRTLRIPLDQIQIHISSRDTDLIDLLREAGCPIGLIFDEKPGIYYTHKYGMGEIVGRNFNFALREKGSERFNDIGNYIFIESGEKKFGVELALGTSVIMKELFELDHVMDTSIISSIFPAKLPLVRKLQDCIVSAVLLYRLGVRPNASNTKGRILRAYLRGISHLHNGCGLSREETLFGIQNYELLQFGVNTDAPTLIATYLNRDSS